MRDVKSTLPVAVIILFAISSAIAATPRDRLDGWGPFKFTMTRTQAMASVKGRGETGASGQMIAPVEIDGTPWIAELRFLSDPSGSIRNIALAPAQAPTASSADECAESWRALVARVEGKYGAPDDEKQWTIPVLNLPARGAFFRFQDGGSVEVDGSFEASRRACVLGVVYNAGKRGPKAGF